MSIKKAKKSDIFRTLLLLLLAAAVLFIIVRSLNNLGADQNVMGRDLLEDAIRRSAAACYASEGAYPQDLNYLTEHYGLQIDEERYIVHYDVFAENLMPDITVMERTHE